MSKKKVIIKIIVFAGIFVLLWTGLSEVIGYKWDASIEKLSQRYKEYEAEPAGSIDVLFFGSSPTYEGYVPAEMYHDTGITSINFGTSNNRSLTEYFNLLYALKFQTPKVVVVDFMGLKNPEYKDYSARNFIENVPDLSIRLKTIQAVHEEYPDEEILPYFLPLLHYHSRWDELEMKDFKNDTADFIYEPYLKGNIMATKIELQSREWNIFSEEESTIADVHFKYYDKILEECRSRGIKMAIVLPPRYEMTMDEYNAALSYAKDRDVYLMDNMSYEVWDEIGLNVESSFNDFSHLNIEGARLYSKYVAEKLQEEFDLPDHRGDSAFSSWDSVYE